jgi:hypothetical protein
MNAEEITQALQEKGFIVDTFRSEYLSVAWSTDHEVNMARNVEYMTGNHSTELEELFAFLSDNGWRHEPQFVPVEYGYIITTLDS